ncbi:hypothetical protein J1N51_10460 [Psychrosphaera ytuae]|uniref:Uncharacterized protein n=1 Tax=Psychrosphaera ytuae TaxID=2820710 RepID=A0A975DAG3_9GAMM|nr:hypothetical protein [Psychrosphaera ytuae]QTH63159.1 hypothetical protein J1N51_10460 [Psychrosphaera ytuae]
MQSLILATSIALTSPVSISNLNDTEALTQAVHQEVNAVRKVVQYQTKIDIQDTFLFQAKHSIALAKKQFSVKQSELGE